MTLPNGLLSEYCCKRRRRKEERGFTWNWLSKWNLRKSRRNRHPRNRHHWHHCNSTRKSCCRHCCCCLWLVITSGFLLVWFIIYSRNNSNGKFNKLTFLRSGKGLVAKKNDLFRQQYFPFTGSTSLTILYLMKRKNLRSTVCSYLLSIKKNWKNNLKIFVKQYLRICTLIIQAVTQPKISDVSVF